MEASGTEIAVRIPEDAESPLTIKAVRDATGMGIGDIRRAIYAGSPIAIGHVCSLSHKESEQRISALIATLSASGFDFELLIDGETESPEYYRNICNRWIEIGEDQQLETDLHSGEPTTETLERLKKRAPADVFQATISQIVAGDGYTVDDETMAWAKRNLTNA